MSHQEPERGNRQPEGQEPETPFPMIEQEWTLQEYANSNAAHILCGGKKIHDRSFPYDIAAEIVAAHQLAVKNKSRFFALWRENDTLKQQLAAERKNAEKAAARAELAQIKLEEARTLLFAVQPFCEAWAAFDLADDIKDFLDGKEEIRLPKKQGDGQEPAGSSLTPEHEGGEEGAKGIPEVDPGGEGRPV